MNGSFDGDNNVVGIEMTWLVEKIWNYLSFSIVLFYWLLQVGNVRLENRKYARIYKIFIVENIKYFFILSTNYVHLLVNYFIVVPSNILLTFSRDLMYKWTFYLGMKFQHNSGRTVEVKVASTANSPIMQKKLSHKQLFKISWKEK